MSTIDEEFLTLRQAMERLGARGRSTVWAMIRRPGKPDAPLVGHQIPGLGWLVTKSSVENLIRRERRKAKAGKAPRGWKRGRPQSEKKPAE